KSRSRDDPDAWLLSTTIITTSSTDALGQIHDRMPLVVAPADWHEWLTPDNASPAVDQLLVPAGDTSLEAYPVSTRVNSVRNNGPDLIEPLPA
ncbi:MAG TPA: SOS response-associated peptidase family protein, partial [Actinomycetes bacterium]|nr:SOS response-associated peptidase family protein [Actinomycetes bacterium]